MKSTAPENISFFLAHVMARRNLRNGLLLPSRYVSIIGQLIMLDGAFKNDQDNLGIKVRRT
jgi:hypothetical protein